MNCARFDDGVKLFLKLFHTRTLGADKHAGLGSVNVDYDFILSALDMHFGNTVSIILFLDIFADFVVFENEL